MGKERLLPTEQPAGATSICTRSQCLATRCLALPDLRLSLPRPKKGTDMLCGRLTLVLTPDVGTHNEGAAP